MKHIFYIGDIFFVIVWTDLEDSFNTCKIIAFVGM